MKKSIRKFTYPLLSIFLFTFVPALCCCMDIAGAGEPESHHSEKASVHEDRHGDHGHQGGHHQGPAESSHNHSQCNHPQLVADFVNQTIQFFASHPAFFKIEVRGLPVQEISDAIFRVSSSPPLETGPPGSRYLSNPLYLEVLRI